jgi:hypothetical protein
MSPSIFQLQALGMQDIYLTKNPQINIFKYNYYRYVNFATETVKLNFNSSPSFGQKSTCEIPKRGHLLSKLHLHIRLPQLVKTSGKYACWSDTIGYGIFDGPIELQIGGVIVDRLYPQFLNAWNELTVSDKRLGRDFMLLKSDTYVSNYTNATKIVDLVIPLEFWFTKRYNGALPLLSIYQQDIKVNFKLRQFQECINYDGITPPSFKDIIISELYAEYIFLDDIILKQFQEQKHQFIIEQVQYNGDEIISESINNYNSDIKFNHPCKEIIFFASELDNINTNNYFSYGKQSDDLPLIEEASLILDGKYRFDKLPEFYYRTIFPDNVHSVVPMKYIYCMPFSLRPEDNQPTGSLNMSRFNDITLSVKLCKNNKPMKLYIFGISYNVITIENGTLNMEFVYI